MPILVFKKRGRQHKHNRHMMASVFLIVDSEYVQPGYRERYIESYVKAFLTRIKDVKDNKNDYNNDVDSKKTLRGHRTFKRTGNSVRFNGRF